MNLKVKDSFGMNISFLYSDLKSFSIESRVSQPIHVHCLIFSYTILKHFTYCLKYNILVEFHFTVHVRAIQSYASSISFR